MFVFYIYSDMEHNLGVFTVLFQRCNSAVKTIWLWTVSIWIMYLQGVSVINWFWSWRINVKNTVCDPFKSMHMHMHTHTHTHRERERDTHTHTQTHTRHVRVFTGTKFTYDK